MDGGQLAVMHASSWQPASLNRTCRKLPKMTKRPQMGGDLPRPKRHRAKSRAIASSQIPGVLCQIPYLLSAPCTTRKAIAWCVRERRHNHGSRHSPTGSAKDCGLVRGWLSFVFRSVRPRQVVQSLQIGSKGTQWPHCEGSFRCRSSSHGTSESVVHLVA